MKHVLVLLQDALPQLLADMLALIVRVHQQVVEKGHGLPVVQAPHQADKLIPVPGGNNLAGVFHPPFQLFRIAARIPAHREEQPLQFRRCKVFCLLIGDACHNPSSYTKSPRELVPRGLPETPAEFHTTFSKPAVRRARTLPGLHSPSASERPKARFVQSGHGLRSRRST